MRELLVESCELVEVGSKETKCVNLGCNVSTHEVQGCEIGRWTKDLTQRLPRQARIRRKWKSLQEYVSLKGTLLTLTYLVQAHR
jgi:hypothetical protein